MEEQRVPRERVRVRGILSAGAFQFKQNPLNITWKLAPAFHDRPKLHRRRRNHFVPKTNGPQVIVQVPANAAVPRIARGPELRTAVLPRAGPPQVAAVLVGEKHIGAPIEALRVALKPARAGSQRCEVHVVVNNHQQVDIFRIGPVGHNRADEGHTTDTRDSRRRSDELDHLTQKPIADSGWLLAHVGLHGIRADQESTPTPLLNYSPSSGPPVT